MKIIVISKLQAQQLKDGAIVTNEGLGSFKLNNEGYIEKVVNVTKKVDYTKVFIPNPQGSGMTTLTDKEFKEWQDVSYGLMTIYRGDVKRNGVIVSRNSQNKEDKEYYLAHCSKIVINGFDTLEDGRKVAHIESQSNNIATTFKFTGEIYDFEIKESTNKAPKKL